MNEEKQELRYRQAGVAGTEWSVATTPDEFTQNGFLEIKVINDNGTLNFPFRFIGDDIAKLIVSDSGTNDRQQTSRVVVQTITITPSGTNRSITYTRTRRNVNGNQQWSSWVEPEAASTANIYDGSVTAEKLADDIRPNAVSPLRPLFIAAGAEYNDSGVDKTKTAPWGETVTHKAGHYYLNGLGDITEEQMIYIYINREIIYNIKLPRLRENNKNLRTFIPLFNSHGVSSLGKTSYSTFAGCVNLEVAVWSKNSFASLQDTVVERLDAAGSHMFNGCSKLKYVHPMKCTTTGNIPNMFGGCTSLIEAKIYELKGNISYSNSPNINKESILCIIQNALPTTAISVTLHPDAYARLAGDVEIVAALEAQPLISLVSA